MSRTWEQGDVGMHQRLRRTLAEAYAQPDAEMVISGCCWLGAGAAIMLFPGTAALTAGAIGISKLLTVLLR